MLMKTREDAERMGVRVAEVVVMRHVSEAKTKVFEGDVFLDTDGKAVERPNRLAVNREVLVKFIGTVDGSLRK